MPVEQVAAQSDGFRSAPRIEQNESNKKLLLAIIYIAIGKIRKSLLFLCEATCVPNREVGSQKL